MHTQTNTHTQTQTHTHTHTNTHTNTQTNKQTNTNYLHYTHQYTDNQTKLYKTTLFQTLSNQYVKTLYYIYLFQFMLNMILSKLMMKEAVAVCAFNWQKLFCLTNHGYIPILTLLGKNYEMAVWFRRLTVNSLYLLTWVRFRRYFFFPFFNQECIQFLLTD